VKSGFGAAPATPAQKLIALDPMANLSRLRLPPVLGQSPATTIMDPSSVPGSPKRFQPLALSTDDPGSAYPVTYCGTDAPFNFADLASQTSTTSNSTVTVFQGNPVLPVSYTHLDVYKRQAHSIQAAFLALKQAPDLQSASLALQNFSGQVGGTSQTLVSGFQNLTLSDGAGTGVIANMAGSPASSPAPGVAAPGANPNTPAATPSQNSTISNTVNSAAQKAKQKLKGLSPF